MGSNPVGTTQVRGHVPESRGPVAPYWPRGVHGAVTNQVPRSTSDAGQALLRPDPVSQDSPAKRRERFPSNASTRAAAGVLWMQHGLLPEEGLPARLLAQDVEPSCIACMFFIMTASAVRSSSLGLNHRISVPGSFSTGMWPGGV